MRGFPIDVKQSPLDRKIHSFLRLGCLAAVVGLTGTAIVVDFWYDLGGVAALAVALLMYLVGTAVGLGSGVLFESHSMYLARYRAQQQKALEKGAALFKDSSKSAPPSRRSES